MDKKYELTDETKVFDGATLHRIKALRDFGNVKAGALGGYIEKEENLSHDGNAWVYDNVLVYGDSCVYENAQIYDNVKVSHGSKFYGSAIAYDNAKIYAADVFGNAEIYGNAEISNSKIFDKAKVHGNAEICNNSEIFEHAEIYGNTEVSNSVFGGLIKLCGSIFVSRAKILDWNDTVRNQEFFDKQYMLRSVNRKKVITEIKKEDKML